MSDINAKPQSIALPIVLLVPAAFFSAVVALALLVGQQYFLPLSSGATLVTVAGISIGALLVFGPSRIILTGIFLLALLDHQFRSFIVVPLCGAELHPRELLLILLFAHAAVKFAQPRLWIRWTPLHVAMLLYTAVFVYAAWRGLWLGNDPRAIIAECRAPLFLGAFWVFAGALRTSAELQYYGYLTLYVVVVLAATTIAAFGYFAVTGPIPNTQNALGEFVPRLIAGMPLQAIRPSGHIWFEAVLVVTAGMLFCPREPWYRKIVFAGVVLLMVLAIGAGMMRTALVSVSVSMVVLLWLNLPRVGKGLSLAIALFALASGALVFVAGVHEVAGDVALESADYSLRARAVESAGVLKAIRAQPLLGSGFGSNFEVLDLAQKTSGSSAVPLSCGSLHNVWLYIAWKAGLVGLALAVLALSGMLLYGQWVVNRLPSMNQRCLGRALQAVLVGQLVASVAMPRLTYPNGALFLGLWAVAMVMLEWSAEEVRMPVKA